MKKAAALLGLIALLCVGTPAQAKSDPEGLTSKPSLTAQETFKTTEATALTADSFEASIILSEGTKLRIIKTSGPGETLEDVFGSENLDIESWRTEDGKVPGEAFPVLNGAALFFFKVEHESKVERIKLIAPVEVKKSDSLPKGKTTTLTRGKDGLAIRTVTQVKDSGENRSVNSKAKVNGKKKIQSTEAYAVVKAPAPTITLLGTGEEFSEAQPSVGNYTEKTLPRFTIAPLSGKIITTSPFGMRVHPVTGVYKLHDGQDFAGRCGTPVRAVKDGLVTTAKMLGGYGNQVAVDHGRGVVTTYSHLSKILVKPGAVVTKGTLIGNVGNTGYSTGCHLHFMVKLNGTPKNPSFYLPKVNK